MASSLASAATPLTVSSSSSWPTCTLSYRVFHLQWTLPLCLLLYLVSRPLLTRLDRAKLILLPAIAFVWTTPWDNLIVKNQAWFYRRHCIWFTVGYVPIEEYFFFVIQSIMTTLWCSLVTRWFLPNLYTGTSSAARRSTPYRLSAAVVPAAALLVAGGVWMSRPFTGSYYMAMIVWWAAIPLGLLMWGTIDFVVRMGLRRGVLPFLLSVAAPSVYLWASDIYALRRGTWHINEHTSLNIFPIRDLPIEEMTFFVATNTILVTACYAFDRCVAICWQEASKGEHVETPLSPSHLPLCRASTYVALWRAFIRSDDSQQAPDSAAGADGPAPRDSATSDLSASLAILTKASKSFSAASLLLPWDLRTDLSSLYAFCRVADDLVDDAGLDVDAKEERLRVLGKVLDVIYPQAASTSTAVGPHADVSAEGRRRGVREVVEQSASQIPQGRREEIRAAACSVIPLTSIVPRRLWDEMVQGYLTDLDFERADERACGFDKMDQLVAYAQCVAGCVGEMCTRVIMARCGQPVPLDLEVERAISLDDEGGGRSGADAKPTMKTADGPGSGLHSLLYEARRMGVSLQLVNIARDLVADAVELKRCYLPLSMLDKGDKHFQQAMLAGRVARPTEAGTAGEASERPKSGEWIEARQLRKYALRLLDLSEGLYAASYPALARLPNPSARAGLRAACAVYAAIGDKIRSQSAAAVDRGERARMSTSDRLRKALMAIYLD
ncbi:related to Bifunctional lycopene cyclase/phytoene synthase [Pseudozyma flocculosa]|nr:related to Bifunctional lycopene cyclase/phytoene synthase [Pseudozyma flocculosa]